MFSILGTDGKEYGPVSPAKIQEWMHGGRANLQTRARRANETEWKTLADFPEFAPTSAPPPMDPAVVALPRQAPVTPAAGPLDDATLASPWIRLGAVLLDTLLSFFVLGPALGMLAMAGAFSTPDAPNTPLLMAGIGTAVLGGLIIIAVQLYLLVTRGQTVGKKLLGIKIVTVDTGQNPGFVKTVLLRVVVNGFIGAVPVLGGIYSLVDALFIFRADHRCIHDLLAGTKVVRA